MLVTVAVYDAAAPRVMVAGAFSATVVVPPAPTRTPMLVAPSESDSRREHRAVTGRPVIVCDSASASVNAASPAASVTGRVVVPLSTEQESVKSNGPNSPTVALVETAFVTVRSVVP